MIRAGTLNKQIQIFTNSITKDEYGSVIESGVLAKTVRASINPINGTENFIDSKILNEVDYKITIRYPRDFNIDEESYIIYNGNKLDIINSLNFQEANEHLMLLCKERKDG